MRGRTPLTRDKAPVAAGVENDATASARVRALWDLRREESALFAARLRAAAPFWADRDASTLSEGALDDVDEADLAVATALRVTTTQAAALIRDGHVATAHLPRTLERLAHGDMPPSWFTTLLRSVRDLPGETLSLIDERVAEWDLHSIAVSRFRRELRLLITWLTTVDEAAAPPPPESFRDVALVDTDSIAGTATMHIVGPIPEILSLSHRLDAAARSLQRAQRDALEHGTEIPFDLDGAASTTGMPLRRAALRYAALTRTVLDTGGVEVPPDRFRMNVVVPALTLLGVSDAPGMVEGAHPIPAPMARALAAQERTWYRILTDPATGIYLPAAADAYRPTAQMLEHLRLRNPVCAVPGCTRSTRRESEADHIEEFNHADPLRGGPTALSNLHLLCQRHHRLKTHRRIDPERVDPEHVEDPPPQPPPQSHRPSAAHTTRESPNIAAPPRRSEPDTAPNAATRWRIGSDVQLMVDDCRDLATPETVATLTAAWTAHRQLEQAREAAQRDAEARDARFAELLREQERRRRQGLCTCILPDPTEQDIDQARPVYDPTCRGRDCPNAPPF